jgi:calcineurin-like phosphoesterase family protein
MATWFTADHHFGHGGARGLFRRPFASTAAMDEALVERWNQHVGPADVVWHLGDFAVRRPAARIAALLALLAGAKHLIRGNNDGEATTSQPGWASVQELVEIEEGGTRLVLCHYPLRRWHRMDRGALNLHGHSHGRLAALPRQVDVGVDVFDFRPVTLAEIRQHLRRRGRRPAARSGRRTAATSDRSAGGPP